MFDRGVFHVVLVGYSVYHFCFRFDSGVVHIVFVLLSTITA
jgi:ABC-type iron transport system FetAB permease component